MWNSFSGKTGFSEKLFVRENRTEVTLIEYQLNKIIICMSKSDMMIEVKNWMNEKKMTFSLETKRKGLKKKYLYVN